MTNQGAPDHHPNEELWRNLLEHGSPGRWAFLPSDPRCMGCKQPFAGIGGKLLRVFTGYRPSRKSPNICNRCDEVTPLGGAEVDTAVLFADIRGSTGLAEERGAGAYAALISRFYKAATRVITVEQPGWLDKFVGDELMALFIPSMGSEYRARAVHSAVALLQAVGYAPGASPWLPLAAGLHAGPAFVGKPGTDASSPVTALGDTVNATARIQAQAAAGEILLSEELYGAVESVYPGLERRTLTLRGRQEPVDVRVLRPAER